MDGWTHESRMDAILNERDAFRDRAEKAEAELAALKLRIWQAQQAPADCLPLGVRSAIGYTGDTPTFTTTGNAAPTKVHICHEHGPWPVAAMRCLSCNLVKE